LGHDVLITAPKELVQLNAFKTSCSKPLVCIYTNNEKNEFAIGFREDENFTAVTKVGDFYTRLTFWVKGHSSAGVVLS